MHLEPESGTAVGPRGVAQRLGGSTTPTFSICTMLTNWPEYRECIASFVANGFDEGNCEFIVIDNSVGNRADAYVALNELLQAAVGRYVILCHQDILLLDHDRSVLENRLDALSRSHPRWGVCGNAGYTADGYPVLNLLHPHGRAISGEPYPRQVISLDENFLVVRREANLAVSRDLAGFHHYGADLCVVADVLGWEAYVIDFVLRHKSMGSVDDSYARSRDAIRAKYARAFRPRWIHVVLRQPFYLSGSHWSARLAPSRLRLAKMLKRHPRDRDLDDIGRGTRSSGRRD